MKGNKKMANIAVYNGQRWSMPDGLTPEDFLRRALVPRFPDLQGAQIDPVRVEDGNNIYEYHKKAGQKGASTTVAPKDVIELIPA
jgi:PRTRC genetic system protein C